MRARVPAVLVASLLSLPCVARAQPAAQPEAPSAEAVETARRLFHEGVVAAQAQRWDEAAERFSRTLQIRPAPIVRFNLAVVQEHRNLFIEAIDLYRQYLRETPRESDPARTEAAAHQIDALAPRLARLRVVVTGDDVREFRLDGRAQPVALLGVDIPVNPGTHTVDLIGVVGDRTHNEGGFVEGDTSTLNVELSRTPPVERLASADWRPRTQPFGRWVTRPGPDGRWIDWAARATVIPPSIWRQRPFTVALQVGLGAPAGAVAIGARYFPQPWFGAEVSLGALGAFGPSAALAVHARIPWTRFALGVTTALGVGMVSATTSCTTSDVSANHCARASSQSVSAYALTVTGALTAELRLGAHFTVRAMAGARVLTNPSDLATMDDPAVRPQCTDAIGTRIDGSPCALYTTGDTTTPVSPVLAVDLGYGF